MNKFPVIASALAAAFAVAPVMAQYKGHDMHGMQMRATKPQPKAVKAVKAAPKPKPGKKAGKQESSPNVDRSKMDHSKMDHSKMDHSKMDHSKMDHSKMDQPKMDQPKMDQPKMDQPKMDQPKVDQSNSDHSKMDHGAGNHSATRIPLTTIPEVTDADLAAAFPPVHAHHTHGTSIQNYTLIDRLEASRKDGETLYNWEATGWVGGDVQKFMWRTEGHGHAGKVDRGNVEVFYSRGVRAWWDVVAGVRHDFGHGPTRQWVGVGVQGFAPYKFEVNATVYVGDRGRTALRAGTEYDTLLTNRLILQWRAECNAYGKDDPVLGIGSGVSTVEVGTRLRYEINRQFAPYVGVDHERAFGRTADFRKIAGKKAGEKRFVAGFRIWF